MQIVQIERPALSNRLQSEESMFPTLEKSVAGATPPIACGEGWVPVEYKVRAKRDACEACRQSPADLCTAKRYWTVREQEKEYKSW